MAVLSKEEIDGKLRETRGWWLQSGELAKDYNFGTEEEARIFADGVTALAENLGKHPDIKVEGTQVLLATRTRSEGGVTQCDLRLAAEAEKISHKPIAMTVQR